MQEEKAPSVNIFLLWEQYKPLVKRIFRFWYIALAIGVVVGLYLYSQEKKIQPTFSASLTFILEDELISPTQTSAQGNPLLAALTSQNTTSSNKAIMLDLAKSNKLIEESLLNDVMVDGKKMLLGNYFIETSGYKKDWIASGDKVMSAFTLKEDYKIGSDPNTDYWMRTISNQLKTSLKAVLNDAGLFKMDFTSNHEQFTKLFLETHLHTISQFYIDKKAERSRNMVNFTKRKRDSLVAMLQGREYTAASLQDQGFGVVKKAALVPEIQIKRDITILSAQYNESVAALNSAKLDLERQKPFLSIVDDIRFPLAASYPKPLNKGMMGFFGGFIFMLIVLGGGIFGLDWLKQQRQEFLDKKSGKS
jgi:hypothetical protein